MHGTYFDKDAIVSQKGSTQDKSTQWKKKMTSCASQNTVLYGHWRRGEPGSIWLYLISGFVYLGDLIDCASFTAHTHVDHSDVRPPHSFTVTQSSYRGRGDVECGAGKKKHGHKQLHKHSHTHTLTLTLTHKHNNNKQCESRIER